MGFVSTPARALVGKLVATLSKSTACGHQCRAYTCPAWQRLWMAQVWLLFFQEYSHPHKALGVGKKRGARGGS
eukprot:10865764-Prorocentrum_lima.AAC.1